MSDVHDDRALSRYELTVDGHFAFAAYTVADGVITFTHTVVPDAIGGRGVASRLIAAALDDVRGRDMKVVAQCAFVADYVGKHPEVRDLLA